jgi:type I restriction enzyme S subunit
MAAWRACKLGEVVNLKRGYDLPHDDRVPGPFPIVSSSGITDHHAEAKVKGPGVITGRYGTLGEVFFVEEDFWPLNTSLYVQDFKGNDPRFISYFLRELNFATRDAAGAVPGVNRNHLHAIDVRVPPLPLQQRIGSILSAYDKLIENNQRRIRILESMARALYREWFVDFRFPGHEKFPRVASPFGDIPQGWEVVSLDDVCERVTDGSHSSPDSVEDGLPMASSKDMQDWGLTLETCRFIGREDFDQLVRNGSKPKKNDVLITKDGANYLKYIFVNRMEQELVVLSSIAILRPNTHINPHLLVAILKSPENRNRLKNYVTGAAIPRIVLKDFKRFQFVLPSKIVQTQWVKVAEPLTELCWRLVDQIQNLRWARDLLLPRLLSGQVSLS